MYHRRTGWMRYHGKYTQVANWLIRFATDLWWIWRLQMPCIHVDKAVWSVSTLYSFSGNIKVFFYRKYCTNIENRTANCWPTTLPSLLVTDCKISYDRSDWRNVNLLWMIVLVHVPQSISSDISPQSLFPSQTKNGGIQRVLLQVNSLGEHVGRGATHRNMHRLF